MHVVAERVSTPDLCSGDSGQQSVGLNLSRDSCVLKQDTKPLLLRPSDGTQSRWSHVCLMHVKELIEKRRSLPRYSWFEQQHIAPQHLVNDTWCYMKELVPYMYVLKKCRVTLQGNAEC